MKQVRLVTDGSCIGNPGLGGWACVLRFGEQSREMFGSAKLTTNNRMELMAALEGLRALTEDCEVELVTDSEYLKNGMTKWLPNWKRRNWMTAQGKPVLNRDLWEALEKEVKRHKIVWQWTKGHASHADNNRADELANSAARGQLNSTTIVG
jgi:ribonuclease HI